MHVCAFVFPVFCISRWRQMASMTCPRTRMIQCLGFQFIPKAFSYTSAHPSKTFSDPFLCTGKRKGPSPNCFHKIVSVLLAIMWRIIHFFPPCFDLNKNLRFESWTVNLTELVPKQAAVWHREEIFTKKCRLCFQASHFNDVNTYWEILARG